MITQRYGNNIHLYLVVDQSAMAGLTLEGREIVVKVRQQFGKRIPFSFTIEGNTIKGTILGMDQPTRPDALSIELHIDSGTPRQQVINLAGVIRLVSDSIDANIGPSQAALITCYGNRFTSTVIDLPTARATSARRVKYTPSTASVSQPTSSLDASRSSLDASPDITLS